MTKMTPLYRPITIGHLKLNGNLFLAPVAGWTNRIFRSLCVEAGAALTFTELISSEALVRGGTKTTPLLLRAPNETQYAIQLFGAHPSVMGTATERIREFRPSVIDINAGCPVPKVTKTGAGAALMKTPTLLAAIVDAVVRAADGIPVTVKLRSGWDAASYTFLECAAAAAGAGAAMISLHPRTRAQGYAGQSNWEHIAHLTEKIGVPVTGSGDLYTPEDARAMLETTGCAAVMFARGALGNPAIFTHTRALLCEGAWKPEPPASQIATAFRHLEALALDIGETKAAFEMRKVFCAYTKGVSGGAALRNALVRASSIAEYRRIFQKG
ncbi:MAG: tRNA dihydrouridine synthase DusB [Spirochaetaceae bacterium]|jgi:nifR3 family TIM-barrel protein|nr:tRNA dihydrouridine synthase DusB [Spirochaetaceae bacterium]